ncbi:MAG: metallophosphoesterase [Chloroflexi bacterium]|nr:metallophosphoesterase [Chloroflexota bacterium]
MKRIVWLTDIHLEMVPDTQQFLAQVKAQAPDIVFITGDIAERNLEDHLRAMVNAWQVPVYFVLGNHDYYHRTIATVRSALTDLHDQAVLLHWLPRAGVVALTSTAGVVGHGGWSDGRYGDYERSSVTLQDYQYIQDLQMLSKAERIVRLHALADESAEFLRATLPTALDRFSRLFVLTHSPPFREATWYQDQIPLDDNEYLPHFSCKAVGDVLLDLVPGYPNCDVTVLCGHTHWGGEARILDNLLVITGQAEYGSPAIQRIFTLNDGDTSGFDSDRKP